MKRHNISIFNSTFALALLSTGFLLYNMLTIAIYREQVFLERGTFSNVEIIILTGFGTVFLFDIVSFLWILSGLRRPGKNAAADIATLVFAALCLVLLIGEKTMVDEIGREYPLGWEVLGEWIILYAFLTTQLVYNLVVLMKLFRILNAPFAGSAAGLCRRDRNS